MTLIKRFRENDRKGLKGCNRGWQIVVKIQIHKSGICLKILINVSGFDYLKQLKTKMGTKS